MTGANVERLQPHGQSSAPDAPALGMSLQVDLGAGRVCTLQTFVPSDCSEIELNRMLDKMTGAGARQRAAYKIEELERDLEKLEREQAQHREDLARIDVDYEAAQAKRAIEAENAQKAIGNMEKEVADAAGAAGRRGPVELKGAAKANRERVQSGINKLQGEILIAKEEHDKAHGESAKTIERRQEVIVKAQTEIERCRQIVAAGLVG